MSVHDIGVKTIDGEETTLAEYKGKAVMVVNVASKCGFTPQYEALQKLYTDFHDRGFEILGFPCNQFGGQEPGTNEEIKEFCSLNWGVTFPMFDKVDVNGDQRHPLYDELTKHPDHKGNAGDVGWNFEKFLISPEGEVVARFRTNAKPDAPYMVSAIEEQLPG
jgi:glutathione peroxidase